MRVARCIPRIERIRSKERLASGTVHYPPTSLQELTVGRAGAILRIRLSWKPCRVIRPKRSFIGPELPEGGDMHWTRRAAFYCAAIFSAASLSMMTCAQTNPFAKGQVADRIRKVEDGVDEFQKYLNNRADDAKNRAESAQSGGATSRRQRDSANSQN